MLPNIGLGECLAIAVVALLLFGAKKLPEAARGIGRSLNAFKQGLKDPADLKDPPDSDSRGA